MNARTFHAIDAHHRASELTLERAAQIDILLELGRANARAIEDLEAHAPAAWQAARCQFQP